MPTDSNPEPVTKPNRWWRQYSLLVLFAVVTIVAVTCGLDRSTLRWNPLKRGSTAVVSGAWRGWDEVAILKLLGPPTTRAESYRGVGQTPAGIPAGPRRTLRYVHQDGYLVIWLQQRDGQCWCFDSLWYDKGVDF